MTEPVFTRSLFDYFDESFAINPRKSVLELVADSDAYGLVTQQLENLLLPVACDLSIHMQLELVLEELITNIVNHAYPDKRQGHIACILLLIERTLLIKISDDGDPFDPFSLPAPDLSLSIAERPIGGLGVHLIRSYMNDYAYRFHNGLNQVVLKKTLSAA